MVPYQKKTSVDSTRTVSARQVRAVKLTRASDRKHSTHGRWRTFLRGVSRDSGAHARAGAHPPGLAIKGESARENTTPDAVPDQCRDLVTQRLAARVGSLQPTSARSRSLPTPGRYVGPLSAPVKASGNRIPVEARRRGGSDLAGRQHDGTRVGRRQWAEPATVPFLPQARTPRRTSESVSLCSASLNFVRTI